MIPLQRDHRRSSGQLDPTMSVTLTVIFRTLRSGSLLTFTVTYQVIGRSGREGLLDVFASRCVHPVGDSAALFGIARRYRVTSSCLPTSSPFLQQLPASASVAVFSLGPWPRDQILTSRGSVSATDTPRRWSLLQVSSAFEAPWAWGCVHLLISCLLDVAST